jgi:hypothetical protein
MSINIEQGSHPARNGAQQNSESLSEYQDSPDERRIERRAKAAATEVSEVKDDNRNVFERLSDSLRSPTGGATIAGAIGLGAATMFGVVETLVGAGAAYGVYRLVCKRQQGGQKDR